MMLLIKERGTAGVLGPSLGSILGSILGLKPPISSYFGPPRLRPQPRLARSGPSPSLLNDIKSLLAFLPPLFSVIKRSSLGSSLRSLKPRPELKLNLGLNKPPP